MNIKNNIPLYSPSVLDSETLNAIFVKREKLLASLVSKHKSSVLDKNKYFSLLVAPRGMGKTHLISMLYHELKKDNALDNNMLLVWLREEEWGISSYLDLLVQILQTIQNECQQIDSDEINALFEQEQSDAEYTAEKLLQRTLSGRVLVLLAENLNIIFEGMGTEGQEKLRALIQNTGQITIIAATQALFSGVTLRSKPFYGFFTITHLTKFTLEDALQLLLNIANRDENTELIAMLKTDQGRARVRALHHLAGGSPRIYVLFSQFIQADSLDDFTGPIMKMLDELTPYYQAKMMQLSPQQRKLIMYLCRNGGAVAVQDLANKNHITQQTASSQLKKLKEAGFVEAIKYGRQSYYEIAEPLLRMVLSVKDNRGAPVKLAIDLIRHFFTATELKLVKSKDKIDLLGMKCLTQDIVNSALTCKEPDPHVNAAIKAFEVAFRQKNYQGTQQIVNDFIKLNSTCYEQFSEQLNHFIEKLFYGKGKSNVKVANELLLALPADGKTLKRDVLATLLIYIKNNNEKIKSLIFNKLISNLPEDDQTVLSIMLFSSVNFINDINLGSSKKDRQFIIEAIESGVSRLPDDLFEEWYENLLNFLQENPVKEYSSELISLLYACSKLSLKNVNLLLKTKLCKVKHLAFLLLCSVKEDDPVLFETIALEVNQHPQYKSANAFVITLSQYIENKDPKELSSLSKEVRNLILEKWDE